MPLVAQEFDQTGLLHRFNESVVRRMAEEHVFLNVLDEVFQAQGQEITRNEKLVQELRICLAKAQTQIAKLQNQQQQCTNSEVDAPSIENTVIRPECFCNCHLDTNSQFDQANISTPDEPDAEEGESNGGSGSGSGSGSTGGYRSGDELNECDNKNDDDDYEPIIPDITIKEEIDEESGSNSLPTSDLTAIDSDAINDVQIENVTPDTKRKTKRESSRTTKTTGKTKRTRFNVRPTFECPFCKNVFSMWSAMKRRVLLDNGEKVFTCKECKEKHNLVRASHAYKKPVDLDRPYKCKMCNKRFTQSSSLACHIRSHTGERPFPCVVCGRSFARSDYLKAHMKIQ